MMSHCLQTIIGGLNGPTLVSSATQSFDDYCASLCGLVRPPRGDSIFSLMPGGMADAAITRDLHDNYEIDKHNTQLYLIAIGAQISWTRRCLRLAMPEDIPIWYNLFSNRGRFSSDWQPSAAVDCPSVHVGQGRKRKMDPTYELKMRKGEHYSTWLRRQEKYEEKFLPSTTTIARTIPAPLPLPKTARSPVRTSTIENQEKNPETPPPHFMPVHPEHCIGHGARQLQCTQPMCTRCHRGA